MERKQGNGVKKQERREGSIKGSGDRDGATVSVWSVRESGTMK